MCTTFASQLILQRLQLASSTRSTQWSPAMAQRTLDALAEGHALLQNDLLPRDVFESSCKELLGRLVSCKSVSWADKQQALVSAKQHGVCEQLLLEAGQQLWHLKMESWRLETCSTATGE